MLARVVEVPQLGTLILGVPAMLRGAEGEDALLGARLLFVAPRAAERRVEAVFVQRLLQGLRLHDLRVDGRSVHEGVDAHLQPFAIDMHDQIHAHLRGHAIAEGVHVAEFPGGVHVHEREGRLGRMKRLPRKVQHDRAVLAD